MITRGTSMPYRTSPTWEVELLISAASVFTLVQLPGWLDVEFLRLQIRLHDHYLNALAFPLFLYVKAAVVCLAATFLIHLCLRAYWVGLIGLDSVFPGGPNIEHLNQGPHYKAHLGRHYRADSAADIERADNRSTVVFGFGVGLALIMVIPTVLVGLAAALALLMKPLVGSKSALMLSMLLFVLPLMLAMVVPAFIDKVFGARYGAESRVGRALAGCYGLMRRIHMDGTGNRLIMYLYGKAKTYRNAVLLFAAGGMLLGFLSASDVPRLSQVRSQDKAVTGMERTDYASERDGDMRFALRAHIPAARIEDGWLDVTLPLPTRQPANDLPACQTSDAPAIRRCLLAHASLTIDGKTLPVQWQVQEARDGAPPVLRTLIDVAALPRGRHRLTLDYLPHVREPVKAWREHILFWN